VCVCVYVCVYLQSVHDEVQRRCRGVSDSLSKYLRVMRCVTLDEVLTARQRIEKARFKADSVIALSANRFVPKSEASSKGGSGGISTFTPSPAAKISIII